MVRGWVVLPLINTPVQGSLAVQRHRLDPGNRRTGKCSWHVAWLWVPMTEAALPCHVLPVPHGHRFINWTSCACARHQPPAECCDRRMRGVRYGFDTLRPISAFGAISDNDVLAVSWLSMSKEAATDCIQNQGKPQPGQPGELHPTGFQRAISPVAETKFPFVSRFG
jgi:hypothetical protein